jgi:hypothetical protein
MNQTNGNAPTLEDTKNLLERDGRRPVFLHIAAKKKGPTWKGWTKITHPETLSGGYQALLRSRPNTGILLGAPSDNLCAIDLDTETALHAFLALNPAFQTTLRTHGARGAQLWAYVQGERPHQTHALKVHKDSPLTAGMEFQIDNKTGQILDYQTIGEFRAEGGQSVIRGIHPNGCYYTWPVASVPITILFNNIRWPSDIAIPWEKERKAGADSATEDLLKRAIANLTVDGLWQHFGFTDRGNANPVASPFRTDNTPGHPSFSIYDEGRRFKDHNAAYEGHRGDSFDFYRLKTGEDSHQAFKGFVELAGLGHELAGEAETSENDDDPRPIIMHPNDNRYISEFAHQLGKILKPWDFFRFHGIAMQVRLVSVKSYSGKEYQIKRLADLPVPLFSTIIEAYCRPMVRDTKGRLNKKSVSMEIARRTLVCLDFIEQLPEIRSWTDVRLPIRSGKDVILSTPGYDSKSGVYTSPDAPDIDETITLAEASLCWRDLLKEFCFPKSGKDAEDEPDDKLRELEKERCIAVALAAALTPLCLYLLAEKAKRPGFAASANAEGAGKTLLLSFGMVAKLGMVPTGSAPDNEEEIRKVLDSAVQYGVPILFFDNLKGHLSSGELEAFITSSTRRYRLLGTTNYTEADNLSTVYITANFATYSPDLRRRLLAIELFLEESRAEQRTIDNFLDEDALIKMRPRLMSMLWAFIKHWHRASERPSSKLLPSFEQWSTIVGGIVENAGFSSPCQLATLKTGGDTDTQDMERMVSEMNPGAEFRFGDLIDLARDHHLFQRLIPTEGDMDKQQSTRMGFIIRKFVGRIFNGQFRFCLSEGTRKTERYFILDLKKP